MNCPIPVEVSIIFCLILFITILICVRLSPDRSRRETGNTISLWLSLIHIWSTALLIGVFQILALIPGTSRSGSTILGAILLGCSRSVAAEFSFFLSIPVMFGASLLKLLKFGLHFTGYEAAILLVGMVTAFVVSILAIKFLMGYIKKNNFKPFGYYRIALGVLVLAYFIFLG